MFALVMIAWFINHSPPQVIGQFSSLQQCETAVNRAKGFGVNDVNQPRVSYVCIQVK